MEYDFEMLTFWPGKWKGKCGRSVAGDDDLRQGKAFLIILFLLRFDKDQPARDT